MFDFLNIILIAVYSFIGFYRGFVREIIGLVIFGVAVIISLHFAIPLDYIISKSLPFPLLSTVLSHVIIFFSVLTTAKLFFLKTIIQHIKFISTGSDGMLGILFGGLKGLMICLLIFSCLYISGASNSLGLKKTIFYKINHFLYSKLALFVNENEIMALGRLKHVDNGNEENYTELSNKVTENVEPKPKANINENNEYLNNIIKVFRGKTILNSQDDELLTDILSSLPVSNINSIFETCCKDVAHNKEILNFTDDELSVYIADLIIYEYKKNGFVMNESKVALEKKIEVVLSNVYEKKNTEKIQPKTETSENNAVKISTDSSSAPLPIKDSRHKLVKVMVKSKKPVTSLPKHAIKPIAMPTPKRRDSVLLTPPKIVKNSNITKNNQLIEEEPDINTLIEESLKKP